jgi:hypothetical protein
VVLPGIAPVRGTKTEQGKLESNVNGRCRGGKRLFRDDWQLRRLELVDSKTTSTDGVVLTYRSAR